VDLPLRLQGGCNRQFAIDVLRWRHQAIPRRGRARGL
jgi:hypothetical protein